MGFNKKFFTTGGIVASSPAAFDPLQNFETVTYTGNGGTQKITGYIRKGAAFNGSSSYITTSLDFNTLTNYSISLWIYIQATPSASDIFAGTIQDSGALNGFYLSVQTDRTIRFFERNSSTNASALTSTDTINAGSWNHILVVRNGSTNLLYINDGTAVSTSNGTITHAEDFTIGRGGAHTSGLFEGKIDQVRIFNKAISSSEVTTLYGETYADPKKSTTDYFGDGSGVALYELDEDSLSSNFEQAALFNGSSSSIVLGSAVIPSNNFSISMWVNSNDVSTQNNLITQYVLASGSNGRFVFVIDGGYFQAFVESNGSGTNFNYVLSNNTWYHVTLVKSGSWECFVNGTSVGTWSDTVNITTSYNTQLGSRVSSTNALNGKLDQVRIFNTALGQADVTKLYQEASTIPTANLIAHYKLDGNAEDVLDTYDGTASNVTYSAGVYGGTDTNVNYLGMAFQPDLVWVKRRSNIEDNVLFDSVRGVQKQIVSNKTNAESTKTNALSSFDSNGFTTGSNNALNTNNETYVAWNWKAGGAAVSNTDGSITSQVSANQDAGFSIVGYTGNSSNGATVGHGLTSTPEMVIWKNRSVNYNWTIHHKDLTSIDYYLRFTTSSEIQDTRTNRPFGAPSSTLLTLGEDDEVNTNSSNYIAYCFHSVDGYQKVGSYTGTGASGNTITTGFRPRFILVKNISDSANTHWGMFDSVRDSSNPNTGRLLANLSNAESTTDANWSFDFTSNGFEVNSTAIQSNKLNNVYIYLAIA